MTGDSWKGWAARNAAAGFLDACLRGFAQVLFRNNALCGAVLLAGLFWGARAEGRPYVADGALAGVAIATATAWLLLLAAYSFAGIPVAAMGPPALPPTVPATHFAPDAATAIATLAKNVSQVYLVENVVTGVLFLIAIAIGSWRCALFGVLGSVVSLAVAVVFGAKAAAIGAGMFGFSAVLTAIAVGAVFNAPSLRVTLYAMLATVFTVIVQAALDTALTPVGIPTLTFPYVLAMWLFLLPKIDVAPEPHHQPLPNGVASAD